TVLEDYIRVHLLAEMLSELREHFGFAEVSKVERLRISTLSAALDPPFQREGQAAVKFHALVNLVVEGTSMPVTLPGRITRETSGYFGFSLTVTGRAALTLRAGKTVGPPTFLSAEVTSITDESGNAAWQP